MNLIRIVIGVRISPGFIQGAQCLFLGALLFLGTGASLFSQKAPITWPNEKSDGRMEVAYFRREVQLEAIPKEALLNLFADSRYVLSVNQTIIGTGPVRFYPEKPFYDTYNLLPYLRKGKNVIAIKVLSPGIHTFQSPRSIGGLATWGDIAMADGTSHSLAIPGKWLSRKATGYDQQSPKMTFALGPMEVFDAGKEPDEWAAGEVASKFWGTPVPLADQSHWGAMSPRAIPFLRQDIVQPRTLVGGFAFNGDEDIYSFQTKTPDKNRTESQTRHVSLAYTYVHSFKDQTVESGLVPGEHYLNGVRIQPRDDSADPHRIGRANWRPYTLALKKGWNHFVTVGRTALGVGEFYLSLPKFARLEVSPRRRMQDSVSFFRSPVYNEITHPQVVDSLRQFAANPTPAAGWVGISRILPQSNPVMNIAWQKIDEKMPLRPDQTESITLTDSIGSALVFDFGGKQLGRVFIEYEAPSGTVFDLGFSEDTLGEKAFLLKRTGLFIGAKHTASGRSVRFETISPYGLRFLQINVSGTQGKPVTVKRVGVISETYPLEKRGSFRCSDPLLNDIWELGWRTLQVCSEDTYIDTPFRERGLYAGDAVPEYGLTLVTDGGSKLLKQSLVTFEGMYAHLFNPGREADENFTFGAHDDYPLLALQALVWYVARTSDLAYARKVYPQYAQLLEGMSRHRDAAGFYQNQMRPFIEWTTIDKDASPLAPLQMLWAQGMRDMATLAVKLGRGQDAVKYERQRTELVERINRTFWDEEKNAYFDGFHNGQKLDTHFPITGALAVLYGISNPERTRLVLDYLEKEIEDIGNGSRKQKTSTYGSFYILEALYRNARAGSAESFIRKYWSPMVLRHHDTAWENFDDYGIGTLSHAWSGHPTYLLSTQALGVNLEFPNANSVLDEITLAPQSEYLAWAEGSVPHPKGVIDVRWEVIGGTLFLEFRAPKGVNVLVKPRGRLAALNLWVNGKRK